VLRFKLVVKDYIFNYINLINLIILLISQLIFLLISQLIFLPVFLPIYPPVFLPVFLLGLLPTGLYICLAHNLTFLFSGSLSNSFFVYLINVRINAFCKSLSLKTPKLGLKTLISFNNVGFKTVIGVNKQVLS
jgi:hypothetical protein